MSTGDTPFVPIEKIVSLCKRRGFVYPNSEIYGGVSGIYDFGRLGVELRNNIRRFWWWSMVQTNDNVLKSSRMAIPFGICQIGKAFRNEVTPGNFLFRQREFEQWDLQFFVHPSEMQQWFDYWKERRFAWYQSIITHKDLLRFRAHGPDELAHYAKQAFDIEYQTILGWQEWEGIHWRQDWDLSRHSEYSGHDLSYTDPETKERYLPWIVETSGGVDRTFLNLLIDAYEEEPPSGKDKEGRTVLHLSPMLAPVKVAVLPLKKNKEELVTAAKELHHKLRRLMVSLYDDVASIGRR